jgi:hypothetical protein
MLVNPDKSIDKGFIMSRIRITGPPDIISITTDKMKKIRSGTDPNFIGNDSQLGKLEL